MSASASNIKQKEVSTENAYFTPMVNRKQSIPNPVLRSTVSPSPS